VNQAERGRGGQFLFLALDGGVLDKHRRIPFAENYLELLHLKPALEQIDLRGLARAVETFDGDQPAGEAELGKTLHVARGSG